MLTCLPPLHSKSMDVELTVICDQWSGVSLLLVNFFFMLLAATTSKTVPYKLIRDFEEKLSKIGQL